MMSEAIKKKAMILKNKNKKINQKKQIARVVVY